MSDPVKIKPEELWGVWDTKDSAWVKSPGRSSVFTPKNAAESDARMLNAATWREQVNDGRKPGGPLRFVVANHIDLSGWVRKEEGK